MRLQRPSALGSRFGPRFLARAALLRLATQLQDAERRRDPTLPAWTKIGAAFPAETKRAFELDDGDFVVSEREAILVRYCAPLRQAPRAGAAAFTPHLVTQRVRLRDATCPRGVIVFPYP